MKYNEKFRRSLLLLNIVLIGTVLYFIVLKNINNQRPPDLLSYSLTTLAGYLFFLVMPVELVFLYFAGERPDDVFLLSFLTVFLAMISQSIDYFIGHTSSKTFLKKLIHPRRYLAAKKFLDRYGKRVIFMFNLFPLSSPILSLVAGMLDQRFKTVFIYSLMGLLIKYLTLGLFFH